jgi:hypothetical protein
LVIFRIWEIFGKKVGKENWMFLGDKIRIEDYYT